MLRTDMFDVEDYKIVPREDFYDDNERMKEITNEISDLTDKFFKGVNNRAVELEGIGKDEEAEIERHRHLYEIRRLEELEKKLFRLEVEKIKLI